MAYIITEQCIDTLDKSCIEVCPVDCIYHEDGVDRQLYIHPDECIDCGACEPACPVTAIFAEDEVPDASREFIKINAIYFTDKEAARAMTEQWAVKIGK